MNISGRNESSKHVLTNLPDTKSIADFLEFAFDAVVTFDAQERITYWNLAAEQMYGWTAGEALGKTAAELFWPVNTPQEQNSLRQRQLSLEQGATLWGEYNSCRKDGSSLWVQYAIRALFDTDGKINGYLALYRDISVQAQLHEKEEQLKRTNQKLNEILASIQDDLYVLNRDWIFVYASKSFTSRIGKEPKDFVGNNIWQMFPKHVGTAFEENLRATMEKREIRRFEIPGKYTNAWYRMTAFPSEEGITVLGTDITEHKWAEEALKKSEERYRYLLEHAPAAIYVIDVRTLNFTEVNDTMCQMLGYTREELLSMRPEEMLSEESRERFRERMLKTLAGENVSKEIEYKVRAKDGHEIWSALYTTINYEEGQPRSVSVIAHDVTERKQAEQALHESAKRQAFLVRLGDALRPLMDPAVVQETMARMLGEHLGAHRVAYFEVDDGNYVVERDYTISLPPLVGRFRVDSFGPRLLAAYHAGQTTLSRNTVMDNRLTAQERSAFAASQIQAYVGVPLIKSGEFVAGLLVHMANPRDWTPAEVHLIEETAARTWSVVRRARAEQALAQARHELRAHINNSPLAIVLFDAEFHIKEWSAGAERMFGWQAEEVLNKTIAELRWVHEDDVQGVASLSAAMLDGRQLSNVHANRNYRKDGSVIDCEWYNSALLDENGKLISVRSQVLNVTERKRAEQALHENERQLQLLNETLEEKVYKKTTEVRRLASDLVKAEQRERTRISHILHDDLQQRIYALQMDLTLLRDQFQPENEAAREEVSEIERQMGEIRQVIRNLSVELSPPVLPEEGLSHALHWLAAHMQQQHGLPIALEAEGPCVIANEPIHMLLFNCVRELLFNVVKHAQASQAVIELHWSGDGLQIEVRDDGKGFTVLTGNGGANKEELPSSFGLPSIRHQLSLFGGSMQINSEPGAGTRIILSVPIKQAE